MALDHRVPGLPPRLSPASRGPRLTTRSPAGAWDSKESAALALVATTMTGVARSATACCDHDSQLTPVAVIRRT